MKKVLTALALLAIAGTASAQWHHGYHGGYWRGGCWGCGGWVAPAVIGGAVVYAATRPAPPPPSVVYVPNPNPQVLPPAPIGFHYEQILDANCSCYRWVLVQG